MKNVLIVEKQTDKLLVTENANTRKQQLTGKFTEFDVENRNRRFYTAENFIPVMNRLLEKQQWGAIYGEFDHPDIFDISGKSASHVVERLTHNIEGNRVDGAITLLSTRWGQDAQAIINDGFPLFVSSRAAGVTDANRNVILKELHTYDLVLDPGFASSRVAVNESFGYDASNDVSYRIYEMKDEAVNNLFNDNKNEYKTKMDLEFMKRTIAEEMAKLENKIASTNAATTSPEEVRVMMEKYDSLQGELTQVKEYLEIFKKQFSVLVSENKKLSASNKKLERDLLENTSYGNHLAGSVKSLSENVTKLDENVNKIDERITDTENMVEYVAENTKANIMFVEDVNKKANEINEKLAKVNENVTLTMAFSENVAKETAVTQKFVEYVANETFVTQKFTESVAKETEIAQMFAESVAKETEIAQMFAENVAKEANQDLLKINEDIIYHNYIAEKVDGIVGYIKESGEHAKKVKAVLENAQDEEENEESEDFPAIDDYLGLEDEQQIVNNVTEEGDEQAAEEVAPAAEEVTEPAEGTEVPEEGTETGAEEAVPAEEVTEPVEGAEVPAEGTEAPADDLVPTEEPAASVEGELTEPVAEVPVPGDIDPNIEAPVAADDTVPVGPVEQPTVDTTPKDSIVSALVKILGSEDTGIVLEVTPDNKIIIQKSGSEETVETTFEGIEKIEMNDNVYETVNNVLAEIKKQRIIAAEVPHFFSFLTEEQISDFNALDFDTKSAIKTRMNESEYFSTNDVLDIIGTTLKDKTETYDDKLMNAMPEDIKESWVNLTEKQQKSIIVESKYFTLTTTADVKNFWKTRPFAKALKSPEAMLIKESANGEERENNSDEYSNAFIELLGKF